MNSIIQTERECYICKSPYCEEHHIIYGRGYRPLSEKYGLKVYLCYEHHRGNKGAHFNKSLDMFLKQTAQIEFEKTHSHDEWMAAIGRNFL